MYKGKDMNNHDKLSVLGVCDGDLIMMLSNAAPPSRPFSIDLALDGSAMNPAVFQQQLRGDSYLVVQLYDLYQRDPKLAQAICGNDLNRLQEILRQKEEEELGPSIQRFITIKHLAPDDPVEEVLEILQKYAHLVQGLWVPKSSIRNPNARGPEILARDYALLLFSQSPFIKDTKLDVL